MGKIFDIKMNPNYPIYIVSKGRWESRLTSKTLERMNVPYSIIVEEQEYDQYASVIDKDKILILDKRYQDVYDTFDDLGDTKSKGPGAARNFAWDYSVNAGYKWHWVMDDNINYFCRYHNNLKINVSSGTILRSMEDFCNRYTNVIMAGPHYDYFVARKSHYPPFEINTRIYSCNLIRNNAPYRWRGRYNEDTDLSLRMLKDGWCTIQFYAFLQRKITTQVMKGGNTKDFYAKEGTYPKSEMLVKMHPDVTKLSWRYNRWHHQVDYRRFKNNKLIKKPNLNISKGIDNYGMVLNESVKQHETI